MFLESHEVSVPDALFFMKRHKLDYMGIDNQLRPSYFDNTDIYGFFDKQNRLKGLLILEDRNNCWQPHIIFMEDVRGKIAIKSFKEWVEKHIKQYKLLIGKIPLEFKQSILFSKWVGFKKIYQDNNFYYGEFRDGRDR